MASFKIYVSHEFKMNGDARNTFLGKIIIACKFTASLKVSEDLNIPGNHIFLGI